jgi:hypothetical protein
MPQAIQNAKQILIGKDTTVTADGLNGPLFRANTGEIGIFTPTGVRITAAPATTGQKFVLAVSRGANQAPLVSDVIDGANVKIASVKDHEAATEQIDYVGYNGTSGSILDVATFAGELYVLNIILQDLMVGTDAERIKKAIYQSSINDVQADIAIGLVKSADANFSRDVKNTAGDPYVVVSALCNDAGVANAIPAGADYTHFKVTKGSKYVVGTDVNGVSMLGSDETNVNIVPGAYFRAGTAVTEAVYKVIAVTPGTGATPAGTPFIFELSSPYKGANAVIAVASTEYITAALGAAADWGVKVEGKPTNFDIVKSRYTKIRFQLQPNASFGSTVVTNSVRAFEGTGTYEAVASLEDFLNTFRGEEFRMGEPYLYNFRAQHLADSAVDYSMFNITWVHTSTFGFQHELSDKEIIVAFPTGIPDYVDASADALDIIIAAIVGVNKIKGDSVATTLVVTV